MEIKKLEDEARELLRKEFGSQAEGFFFTQPPPHINADLSSGFALSAAKKLGKNPSEISDKISDILSPIADCEKTGGFLNFKLKKSFFPKFLDSFSKNGYFSDSENSKTKINLEFVSANPTGPMHLASGSGASLGDSLARIFSALGYKVHKEYYINNVGNQVKMLGLSLKARFLGREVPQEGYHGEYLKEIAASLPKEAENWPDEKFGRFAMEKIIDSQKKDMADFNVNFDLWFEESFLHERNLPAQTLEILKSKNMAYEKDGAVWLGLADSGCDDKDRVLVKSGGINTYFLNDLAYHRDKFSRGFDKVIDIWGADHHGYIARMKAGLEALGYPKEAFTVIIHQLVSLKKEGETVKMSKRAGEFVTLAQLISEAGTDACRFFFTMRSPKTHLIFDIDLAKKKSNENPVFYVQYVHARICSIFENASQKGLLDLKPDWENYNLNEDERKLILKVLYMEKAVLQAAKELSPHHIPTYLTELAGLFHSFYDKHKVADEENKQSSAVRLAIMSAVRSAIKRGLDMIGVGAPERM